MIMDASTCMSIGISLACILVVTLSWSVFKWVWLTPKKLEKILRDQGFQGNPYKIMYGDSEEKDRMLMEARSKPMSTLSNDILSHTLPFQQYIINNYGNKSFTWNGPTPVVNIGEPEQMREVFMKIHDFQKPQTNPIISTVAPGLIQLEGDLWAQHRKILNPAFHMEKIKFMVPAFNASCNDMINKWEKLASETGSCEIDVRSDLQNLAADVISRAAFGSSYEEGSRIFELLIEQLAVVIPVANAIYIPGSRFIPTKANRTIKQYDTKIRTMIRDNINKRQKAIEAGEKPKDDLLGILLESSSKDFGHKNDGNKKTRIGLSLGEVIDECKIFYLTGQEPTSTLLVWTLIMLSKHQDWQNRAREEVLSTFGSNTPDFHGLNHLKTVNMILQEVLRLYPAVPELLRRVWENIKLGDILIPGGVLVSLPILHVQHDEKIWGEDAKQFNPDRFSEGMSKATHGNMSFFAFGWGPRICIGSNFAMTEARLALVSILQRFSLELSPAYVHAPAITGTLRPQHGAPIILKRL